MKMERWAGKVAVVTGASAGIGLATVKQFVQYGIIVIGLARRINMMKEEMKDIVAPGKFYAKQCDVTNEEEVIEVFAWIKKKFHMLNILINNAGVIKFETIEDCPTEILETVFKVNVFGLIYCTKQAIKLMKENDTEAHIINLNSVAGHRIYAFPSGSPNVYPASKHAVTAMSEILRNELAGSKIRVSSLSPGAVKTVMLDDIETNIVDLKGYPALEPEDVADSIIYTLGAPPHMEINEMIFCARPV